MVKAPCCEKMGLKRGPWTAEEDQLLINFISLYGHGNWRALPRQAGLMRCGKSCRLRWTNYLRPDIKRGNFSGEEEDAIINLHQLLGNRWSAIAARLPGRTDNEIKNVWHTHLKKRISNKEQILISDTISEAEEKPLSVTITITTPTTTSRGDSAITCNNMPPQPSSSTEEISSTLSNDNYQLVGSLSLNNDAFSEIDESFWSNEGLSLRNKPSSIMLEETHNEMEFWYEMFNSTGESFVPEMLWRV